VDLDQKFRAEEEEMQIERTKTRWKKKADARRGTEPEFQRIQHASMRTRRDYEY